jgi:outer membrane receptor protein involved in Fe transport
MSLETTLKYETSEIEQTGDIDNKRDFDFIKPKLDYRFDITPVLQLRATLEKTVSQLSFQDFVAASEFGDNDQDVQAGNVQLQQEEAWEYDLNLEYRLPNDMGVVDASLFYHEIENVIDRIDVSPSPTNLESANGNIGDGERYGLRANASVRLTMIGMPNLLTTTRFEVSDSKVTDPFLGIERRMRFNDRGRLELGFRHDLPAWRTNYGLTWNNRFDGNRKQYDLEDIELDAGQPFVNAFAEYVTDGGITFRLDARSATNNKRCRERQRYVGSIANGVLEEIEDRCSRNGRSLTFRVNGTF